ncbi:MAG: hypothetical protein A2X86_22460 [Bdellovibrionales bacterium GWA2_49_15]|nr:MAG: hypothetical protein A2X86_22460 [Bdellovibrionales bacterium GWA2_49_15]HAZ11552.1 hypothetical protein [Bdellovibrionales bacterium]
MISYQRIQFGVGQGSFHGSEISTENGAVRWVYDFGSRTKSERRNLLGAWDRFEEYSVSSTPNTINAFFISHFDIDHINGLKYLSERKVNISEFILPAYNNLEKIILLCRFASEAPQITDFNSFICNPEQWLLKTFGKATLVRFVSASGEDTVYPEDSESRTTNNEPTVPKLVWDATKIENNIINGGGNASIDLSDVGNLKITLRLFPFFYRIKSFAETDFEKECRKAFKGMSIYDALNKLADPKFFSRNRKKLKAIQNKLFQDSNASSLCLSAIFEYKTQEIASHYGNNHIPYKKYLHNFWYLIDPPADNILGWLGTGDMNLRDKNAAENLFRTMRDKITLIKTFQIPHHGCKSNFDLACLNSLSSVENFIIPYGTTNQYKHPWKILKPAIHSFVRALIEVTEKTDDFIEVVHFTEKCHCPSTESCARDNIRAKDHVHRVRFDAHSQTSDCS